MDWLRRFVATPPDDLILLTGEGLTRLLTLAAREGLDEDFRRRLAEVRTVVRGPKPTAKLRPIGLLPGITAGTPTTEGAIETLRHEAMRGRRVGVQLYPDNPNAPLIDFLREAGAEPARRC